ncbi:MAG: M48 family metallopeptidase [Aminivibrio sp.]|jgi:predicted Zn-dependent protease
MKFGRIFRLFFLPVFFVLILISPQAFADAEIEKEIALGRKVVEEVESVWERVADPALTARLSMLLGRFLPHMSRPLPYEIRVVREKTHNAFSLPGGTIYFTTGMLEFLRTDAEVAAIMAHELIHADNRHVMIQTARASRINLAALALMIVSKGSAGPMMLTNLLQVAVTNSYSKDLEREADKEGFRILVEAGFPSAAMVTVLEAMDYEQIKQPLVDLGVYMTHPDMSERIAYILKTADEKKIPIRRKYALNLLKPSVESSGGKTVLMLDEKPVWTLREDEESKMAALEAAEKLAENLQMETAPYEIRLVTPGGRKTLAVGNAAVAREPLPEGAQSLESLRESLVQALGDARDRHRGAKYLR